MAGVPSMMPGDYWLTISYLATEKKGKGGRREKEGREGGRRGERKGKKEERQGRETEGRKEEEEAEGRGQRIKIAWEKQESKTEQNWKRKIRESEMKQEKDSIAEQKNIRSSASLKNVYDSRESWLRSATALLRPYFENCGYPIPENIRFAIAFPSTGRQGKRIGECWHSSTSEDGNFEVIIRADIADPVEVLGVLVHELLHVVLPIDAGHGKLYRDAALKVGLEGQMRHAMPSHLLRPRLVAIADELGALPHARLNIERGRDNRGPADRPKKQGTRLLKAECGGAGCGYTVRITAKWVDEVGPPVCPKHGPMAIETHETTIKVEKDKPRVRVPTGSTVPIQPSEPIAESV